MLRRGFLAAAGAIAAAPAIGFSGAPKKNWHCLIGGNRSGKSTKAAKMVRNHSFVLCISGSMIQFEMVQARLMKQVKAEQPSQGKVLLYPLAESIVAGTSDDLIIDFVKTEVEGYGVAGPKAVWADECDSSWLHLIAGMFDMVVYSSWPSFDIPDSRFYQDCVRMGTVEHMPMLPHARKEIDERVYGPQDRIRCVEGRFA